MGYAMMRRSKLALPVGLLLAGCGVADPSVVIDDNVSTVAVVTWSADGPGRTRVEIDNADGPWLVTDWQEAGLGLSRPVVGLWADTEYTARVVSEDGGESSDVAFTTGSIPSSVPGYSVAGEPGWEGYLLTGLVSDPTAVVILDETGRVVWSHVGKKGLRALRVRLAPDGSGIRDYIHVMDLAEGHRAALDVLLAEPPQLLSLNLGSGQGHSVLEVVRAFELTSDRSVPYTVVERRDGDAASTVADPRLAATRLGWRTRRYGATQLIKFPAHGGHRKVKTNDFFRQLLGRYFVVRNFEFRM